MADVVDAATRSKMMAGIRSGNTIPEMAIRRALHANGFRYRLHRKGLPGRPDLVFPKFRSVVFVHGCFWHRHKGCHFTTSPSSNKKFWVRKFQENESRDQRTLTLLTEAGWRVAIIWECAVRAQGGETIAQKIGVWLKKKRNNQLVV